MTVFVPGTKSWPLALAKGDLVRIVAPASALADRSAFESGVAVLEGFGLKPEWDPGIFSVDQMWAGSDQRRAQELDAAFSVANVKAVFCARGGYGCTRILPLLRTQAWSSRWWVGFSDATAIHAVCPFGSLLAANVVTLASATAQDQEQLRMCLFGEQATGACIAKGHGHGHGQGRVTATLTGGNLSVLSRLLGTPAMPSLRGQIVVLEDWHEKTYRLDRMWTHLLQASDVQAAAGFALGEFAIDGDDLWEPNAWICNAVSKLGKPMVSHLPFGHGAQHRPVPLGVPVTLDAQAGLLEWA